MDPVSFGAGVVFTIGLAVFGILSLAGLLGDATSE
jgi:hypothetical protein